MSFQIGISQILYSLKLINRGFETVTTQLATGKKINSPKDDPAAWASIRRNRNEFDNYTAVNNSLNSVATSVKIADSSMSAIGKTMVEMRNSLETISGKTPPLPIGDTQRTQLIQSYNEMRGQIDQLASPSDEGARKVLNGPDDWSISIGPNGMVRTIRKEEVHVGPTGLNIPELNANSTDAEIQQALDSLTTAKGTLQTRQQMLQLDSVAIARAQEYNGTLATAHLSQAENAEAADPNEAAAIVKSLELRQTLSEQSLKILSDAENRILQLLA
jgi:flagellin-like hook-associated protein FlgL